MISVDTILSDSHDLSKLDDLCRLCGKSQATFTSIFDETNRYNYYKVILLHFKDELQVSKTDILPLKMCSKCLKSMMSWHEFYLECIKIDKKFKRLINKFNLNEDPEKKPSSTANDVEVIEVRVDGDTYDFFNENTSEKEFDISNINIKESTSFNNANDFSDFHSLDDSTDSDAENKTANESISHSEPDGGDKTSSLPSQPKPKKKKSTVCRICGKLYLNRSTYLTHLQKVHCSNYIAKVARKPLSEEQKQLIEKQKQDELEQLRAQYWQKKNRKYVPPKKNPNPIPEICYICGKTFKPNSLRNHIKFVHAADPEAVKPPLKAPRMCELCGKLCKGNYFNKHMLKHSDPDSVKCKDCNKVFAYESTLKSHIKVCHNDDKPFECTICKATFKRADYLRTHIRFKHYDVEMSDMYKCEKCDMVYKTEKYYQIHLKTHTDNEPVIEKTKRVRRIVVDGTTEYVCKICNEVFKKRNYLLLHERYVHVKKQPFSISANAEGQYKCDQCDRRFSSLSGRNYHCKNTHGKEFDTTFSAKCEHCGLVFSNRVFYAKHRAKLNGMPTCYLCWKQFSSEEELTKHIDVDHFTDLPFVCEICKCRFVALKNLEHHIKTKHLKVKPFKCDMCDHRTTRKDSLEIHIRGTHLGEKPFTCDVCGKRFSQRTDWKKHAVKHNR